MPEYTICSENADGSLTKIGKANVPGNISVGLNVAGRQACAAAKSQCIQNCTTARNQCNSICDTTENTCLKNAQTTIT